MFKVITLCILLSTIVVANEKMNLKFEAKMNEKRKLVILVKKANQLEKVFNISNEIGQENLKEITERAKKLENNSQKLRKVRKNKKMDNAKV